MSSHVEAVHKITDAGTLSWFWPSIITNLSSPEFILVTHSAHRENLPRTKDCIYCVPCSQGIDRNQAVGSNNNTAWFSTTYWRANFVFNVHMIEREGYKMCFLGAIDYVRAEQSLNLMLLWFNRKGSANSFHYRSRSLWVFIHFQIKFLLICNFLVCSEQLSASSLITIIRYISTGPFRKRHSLVETAFKCREIKCTRLRLACIVLRHLPIPDLPFFFPHFPSRFLHIIPFHDNFSNTPFNFKTLQFTT